MRLSFPQPYRFCIFVCLSMSSAQLFAQSSTPSPFRDRTDGNAGADARDLRERLSRMSDSQGPINPLGQFLKEASETTRSNESEEPERWKESVNDSESEEKPRLGGSAKNYKSTDSASNNRVRSGIQTLPGPRYTIIQQANPKGASLANLDGFRPATLATDIEANTRPSLQWPVSTASAIVPNSLSPNVRTANYQLDTPGGNGSVQPPSNFGLNNLPSAVGNGFPAANVPDITPNQPIYPGVNTALPPVTSIPSNQPPVYTAPQPNPLPSGGMVNSPPVVGNPIGGNPPLNPGPIYQAPPTYYQPLPGTGPMMSPSDANAPRYPRSNGVINSQPFVSGAPRQFDACNMVSSTVYRQACDSPCDRPYGNNGYANEPYRGTGSPFSYIPPTYMPSGLYRSPPYPTLVGFGQTLNGAYFSRGIFGQPKSYIDSQPVRNFLRYLSP